MISVAYSTAKNTIAVAYLCVLYFKNWYKFVLSNSFISPVFPTYFFGPVRSK